VGRPIRRATAAALEEVERARASWARLGPALGESGRALSARFERACAAVVTPGEPSRGP
jgi:hypothetical protein